MFKHLPYRTFLAFTLSSVSSLVVLGCSDDGTVRTSTSSNPGLASGNWQVRAERADPALPSFSGAVKEADGKITAQMHANNESKCTSPKTGFELTVARDAENVVTFSGPLGGGILKLSGVLAEDGKELLSSTYSISGGVCATPSDVRATAEAIGPISGQYSGSFSDADGQVVTVSASLEQSSESDLDGNFTLSGAATLPNNPCFPTAVPLTQTQVTGGSFTFTYGTEQNSVTATGTFSQDGTSLTVTKWTAAGSCGADYGTGVMTRQSSGV